MIRLLFLALVLGAPATVFGLGPHQVAVLVNGNSDLSRRVANEYVRSRDIPAAHVITLDVPAGIHSVRAQIGHDAFTERIWTPAVETLRERGLGPDRILAWVYAPDFPIRIVHDRIGLSLTGLTFVRNQPPARKEIHDGTYASPLFAGPARPDGPQHPGMTLERYRELVRGPMPLPSMLLGYNGTRGETADSIRKRLELSVAADRSAPRGTVYFVKSEDVRTHARAWQFDAAAEELRAMGLKAEITETFPRRKKDVVGLMAGASMAPATSIRLYRPGSYAATLTSFGSVYHIRHQTKTTDWLSAGAFASSGTVSEPRAIWTKFPHARMFAFYRRGCTLLESLVQSVRCPLQLLLIGDPLMSPYAAPMSVTSVILGDVSGTEPVEVMAQVLPLKLADKVVYRFFLDGRPLTEWQSEPRTEIDPGVLSAGAHCLRTVVATQGGIRHQAFHREWVQVRREGRGVRFAALDEDARLDASRSLPLRIEAEGDPVGLGVLHHGRWVAGASSIAESVVRLDPGRVGEGRTTLRPVAVYNGGDEVRGVPAPVEFVDRNRPPDLRTVNIREAGDGWLVEVDVHDADGDAVEATAARSMVPDLFPQGGETLLEAQRVLVHKTFDVPDHHRPRSILAEVSLPVAKNNPRIDGKRFGVGWGSMETEGWAFFGFSGDDGCWGAGSYVDEEFSEEDTYGAPLELGRRYLLKAGWPNADRPLAGRVNGSPQLRRRSAGPGEAAPFGIYARMCTPRIHRLVGVPAHGVVLKEQSGTRYVWHARSRDDLRRTVLLLDDGRITSFHSLEE